MRLSDYDQLLACADLRGGNEYETEFVTADGNSERAVVAALVVAPMHSSKGANVSLLAEIDRKGNVIQDWFDVEPVKAMNKWPGIEWKPIPATEDAAEYVRQLLR